MSGSRAAPLVDVSPGTITSASIVYKDDTMIYGRPIRQGDYGYSTIPIKTMEEAGVSGPTVSTNTVKTEVIVTPDSPTAPAVPPMTAYSIPSASLNGVSVRNAENEDIIPWKKTPVENKDPVDGKEMPSHLQKFPGIPMFFEMVDSSNTRQQIIVPGIKALAGENLYISTLKLTPNPETLTINYSKKVNRYTTMSGWVEEHWGDEIETVNFNGSTFSFYDNSSEYHYGLTNEFREKTDSYLYLKELIHYFQVNGCLYQDNSYTGYFNMSAVTDFLSNNPEFLSNHPRKGMIKERLYIKLNYDYFTLYGRFESFDIIEDSKVPFKFKYSAIFKSEKTVYKLDKIG